MSRTPKQPAEQLAPVADEVLDQFGPATGMSMEDIDAATRRLKKALMERMLGGELSHHLGYPRGGNKPDDTPNHRNGATPKTVVTDDGPVAIAVPRDRAGTFAPVLIPKHARRVAGFDDKVLALYARGLPTREIQKFLEEIYGIEVSPTLISEVTDAVLEGVADTAARGDVSGGLLRRVAREDSRRRRRTQQGRLPGAGPLTRWIAGHSGHLD